MFRYLIPLACLILSSSVNAQVDKEIDCALASGQDRVSEMTSRILDVSMSSTIKSDEICRIAQAILREAISIKNATLANKSCPPDPIFRKNEDNLITLTKQTIDEQKCR